MPKREIVDAFVNTVLAEDYVGAIERFYADDASMQENLGVKRSGRLVMAEHERNVLKGVERIKAALGSPVVIDGDRVVLHWIFDIALKDGKSSRLEELAHQRWEGEKIAEERFYYDPSPTKA